MQTLSKTQMKAIAGGISPEEYCALLDSLIDHQILTQEWTDEQWIAATNAWNMYCAN